MELSPLLIDTHAHLDDERFAADFDLVLERAEAAGVRQMLCVGCDLESSRRSTELAARHEFLFASVGVHPHDASCLDDEALSELRTLATAERVVAIGEIGLDYFRNRSPREDQLRAFRRQIALAIELNLPIIVHDRDAHEDILAVLKEEQASRVGGVIHCFSGDIPMARACIEMGFYISLPGTLTYPKNEELRELARAIAVDHMLVETDCPYLAPQPHRGKRNEPAFVRHTAETLARLKGLSYEDVARVTSYNAHRLFGMGQGDQASRIAYPIRNSLYLNITNRCTNACIFCTKFKDFVVKGHELKLDHEPGFQEVLSAIGDPAPFEEIVFCGFGEPLIRLDLVKELAAWLKSKGKKVRVNTDGQASLLHGRDILPELSGLVDEISVSLNAPDAQTYQKLCRSRFAEEGFEAVKDFLRRAPAQIPLVTASAVTYPGVDIEACKALAHQLGVRFREREYNEVG